MKIEINLKFDEKIKVLAGNDFGKKIFSEQVKDKFNVNEINEFIFPKNIQIICSSFVQGFFSSLLEKNSPEKIEKMISASEITLKENLIDGLYF